MAYNNGIQNARAASELRFLVKSGLVQDRGLIDDADPNNWTYFSDNPGGTSKVPALILVDSNGQTRLLNPAGVSALGMSTSQLATPTAPTITNVGTAGVVTWAYKVVAKNGFGATLGTSPASAAGSTTTGNATLTAANYNVITWPSVVGAASYDIYRTTAGTTPSTTGLIGNVPATYAQMTGLQPATYSLNDTALAADGTTAPTTNTTGVARFPLVGDFSVLALSTPVNVVVTPVGTAGVTSYSYKIVARSSMGTTAASAAGSTTTGNGTLSTTNFNKVTWNAVPGALSYDVYRTVGGASQGLIGNVLSSAALVLNDTGLTGDASTAPTTNTTGQVSGGTTTGAVLSVSTNAITPTAPIHHVGAGLIKTITVPSSMAAGGVLYLIPDAAFTYDATGNIVVPAGGGTATVNKLMVLAYDGTKWTPSY